MTCVVRLIAVLLTLTPLNAQWSGTSYGYPLVGRITLPPVSLDGNLTISMRFMPFGSGPLWFFVAPPDRFLTASFYSTTMTVSYGANAANSVTTCVVSWTPGSVIHIAATVANSGLVSSWMNGTPLSCSDSMTSMYPADIPKAPPGTDSAFIHTIPTRFLDRFIIQRDTKLTLRLIQYKQVSPALGSSIPPWGLGHSGRSNSDSTSPRSHHRQYPRSRLGSSPRTSRRTRRRRRCHTRACRTWRSAAPSRIQV